MSKPRNGLKLLFDLPWGGTGLPDISLPRAGLPRAGLPRAGLPRALEDRGCYPEPPGAGARGCFPDPPGRDDRGCYPQAGSTRPR